MCFDSHFALGSSLLRRRADRIGFGAGRGRAAKRYTAAEHDQGLRLGRPARRFRGPLGSRPNSARCSTIESCSRSSRISASSSRTSIARSRKSWALPGTIWTALPAGEMSLSLIERKGEDAALAITIDVTDHAQQAEGLLAAVEKRFAARGGRRENAEQRRHGIASVHRARRRRAAHRKRPCTSSRTTCSAASTTAPRRRPC